MALLGQRGRYPKLADRENFVHPHWEYFLALEADLMTCARFVEPATENFDTYSLEFARLLLSCSSEIDVVAKMLCGELDSATSVGNINQYRELITQHRPRFAEFEINVPRFGLSFTPWHDWSSSVNPAWWRSYNNVKHERNVNFQQANLKNTLEAMCALLAMLLYYYDSTESIESPEPPPRLLAPKWYGLFPSESLSWTYTLPDVLDHY